MQQLLTTVCLVLAFVSTPLRAGPLVLVDADAFSVGASVGSAFEGVTLSVVGVPDRRVVGMDGYSAHNGRNIASVGSLVFGALPILGSQAPTATEQGWETDFRTFRADFTNPTQFVSIDLIADDDDLGQLQAFSASGDLLETVSTGLIVDKVFTASVTRPTSDIAYILVAGIGSEAMLLDNLRFAVNTVPEPSSIALLLGLAGVLAGVGHLRWQATPHIQVADRRMTKQPSHRLLPDELHRVVDKVFWAQTDKRTREEAREGKNETEKRAGS